MKPDNKNIFLYDEKPYRTDEEMELYMKLMIDEATKQGNEELANYYRLLLKLSKENNDDFGEFLINGPKR